MSTEPTKINLRKLQYSPTVNPLVESQEIEIPSKKRMVKSGFRQNIIGESGEISQVAQHYTFEDKDESQFVKVFAAGIAETYSLNRTAQRVFQAVLQQYEQMPMSGGYADAVDLFWFGDGIGGRAIGMSEKNFQRGLKDLLARGFLAPKSPNTYWVNPAMFFRGDRVLFIKEYRRRRADAAVDRIEDRQGRLV